MKKTIICDSTTDKRLVVDEYSEETRVTKNKQAVIDADDSFYLALFCILRDALYIYSVHQPLTHTYRQSGWSIVPKNTSTHTLSGAGIRTINLPVIRRPTLPSVKMYCKVKAVVNRSVKSFAVLWITAHQESISAWPQRQGQFNMLLFVKVDQCDIKLVLYKNLWNSLWFCYYCIVLVLRFSIWIWSLTKEEYQSNPKLGILVPVT